MKQLLLALLLLAWPSPGFAAATLLNTNAAISSTSSTTLSGAQTVNAGGTNVVAVAHVMFQIEQGHAPPTVSAITYGGVAMTSAGTAEEEAGSHNWSTQIFTLVAPSTGSNTLAITVSAAVTPEAIIADIAAFQGVDQTTPVRSGSHTVAAGQTPNPQITVPSATGDIVTTVFTNRTSATPTTSQTLIQNGVSEPTGTNFADDYGAGSASVTVTWTVANADYSITGVSLQAASVGAKLQTKSSNGKLFSLTGGTGALQVK